MTLVDKDRILFPLLYIKISLIKALNTYGDCFTYLCQAFQGLKIKKSRADIFDGPQNSQLIRDPEFKN